MTIRSRFPAQLPALLPKADSLKRVRNVLVPSRHTVAHKS